MRIYVDLDQRQLTSSLGVNSPLPALYFKRGDSEDLTVQFTRNGSVVDPDPDTLFFCVKEDGDFDGDPVVLCTDFTKAGSGTTAKWTGTPDFGTEALNDLLGVGAAADVASVTLNAEVGFNIDGRDTTARTISCVVENDLYRGTETAPPAYPRSQVVTFYPSLVGATGGGVTKLDGLPTEDVAVGLSVSFVINSSPGLFSTWRLTAGTDTEDGEYIIRPDDYATTTNEKVWINTGRRYGSWAGDVPVMSNDGELSLGASAVAPGSLALWGSASAAFGFLTADEGALSFEMNSVSGRVPVRLNTVPATATSTGVLGQVAFDASHAYFCTSANTWKRVAIATW